MKYSTLMDHSLPNSLRLLPLLALSMLALSIVGLAFAGWIRFGDAILLTFSQTGVMFCL